MRIREISRELLHDTDRLTITIDIKDRMQLSDKLKALGVIDPDKEYDIEIKKHRNKRSLDANAYLWVIADKLAEKLEITATDVYRRAIHDVGVFHYGMYRNKDVKIAIAMWESNGVGWVAEAEPSSVPGCQSVKFYHGSSSYDTKQMSRLIDYVVEEAKAQGIETATPDELARMKSTWREQ